MHHRMAHLDSRRPPVRKNTPNAPGDDRDDPRRGFGIAVKMTVTDKAMPTAELKELVQEAHEKICPYSHATRDNVQVEFDVQGA